MIAQYYQLLRLGREGYIRIMNNLDIIAHRLGEGILATGGYMPESEGFNTSRPQRITVKN